MRLVLSSLGRWRRGPEQALFEHYAERFAPLAQRLSLGALELIEIGGRRGERAVDDYQALLSAGPPKSCRIALDATGMALSSDALAALIGGLRDQGQPAITFLIGGADGLGPILSQADRVLSLGPQTWPHLLVRGLLAEQLYRCATILLNHPYHRGP